MIDSLALSTSRRARYDGAPLRWLAAEEAVRMRAFETRACDEFDVVTVVSKADRASMERPDRVEVLPLAVDLERFPFTSDGRRPGLVVLSGNLRYFPNRDAATWWIDAVLPLLRTRHPAVRTELVGAEAPAALTRMAHRHPDVTMIGSVPEMAPLIARASVAVAPLRAGSGVTTKVLEAIACGTPVVATSRAVDGLDVRDRDHLLVADSAPAFAEAVATLLGDPARGAAMAERARRWLEASHGAQACADAWERLYARMIAAEAPGRRGT